MQMRRFGRTGLQVPVLTYGGGWVGGFIIRAEAEAREAVLNRALEAGIDWVDTAAAYGNGASETVLGEWLPKVPKDKRPRIRSSPSCSGCVPKARSCRLRRRTSPSSPPAGSSNTRTGRPASPSTRRSNRC